MTPAPAAPPPVKVVFIAGWGRSGSTILDKALGQLPGFFSGGELRSLWEEGRIQSWACACGQVVGQCPVWAPILGAALQSRPATSPADVRQLRQSCVRTRHLPALWWRARRSGTPRRHSGSPGAEAYRQLLVRLYSAMAATTGARVLVDSSKHPADALVASTASQIELFVIHLVRDPRGAAYSWSRAKEAPGEAGGRMPTHGPFHSSLRWTAWNLAIDGILRPRLGPRYLLVRYEDLAGAPRQVLRQVADMVASAGDGPPAADPVAGEEPAVGGASADGEPGPAPGSTIHMGPTHTVCGNPSRLVAGPVTFREDDEWRRRMSAPARLWATIPALPLLRRYRYPLLRPRPRVSLGTGSEP